KVFAEMADRLGWRPQRKAFVFVHGFNNSFEDAARRTAQIYHDVEFDGVPLFYSWPSKGKLRDYSYDTNNADQAVGYLKAFLQDLAGRGGLSTTCPYGSESSVNGQTPRHSVQCCLCPRR